MWLQGEAFATVMKVRMYTRCTILVLNLYMCVCLIRMYVYVECMYIRIYNCIYICRYMRISVYYDSCVCVSVFVLYSKYDVYQD